MLGQSKGQAKAGVARESLSARQLIADKLDFPNHDFAFIQANGLKSL